MGDIDDVPVAIRGAVRRNHSEMRIRRPSGSHLPHQCLFWSAMLVFVCSVVYLATWVLSVILLVVVAFFLGLGNSFVLFRFAAFLAMPIGAISSAAIGCSAGLIGKKVVDWIVLRNGAYRIGSLGWISVAPEACVRLLGEPVGGVWLMVDDTVLRYFSDADDLWTYDQLLWLGEATASRLRCPLIDTRIEADWRVWEADPRLRMRGRLAWRVSCSQEEFPERHALQPFEPERLQYSVEGTEFLLPIHGVERSVSINAHHLKIRGTIWPWSSVDGVVLVFDGEPCTAYLLMAANQRIRCVASSTDLMEQSRLTWIASAIQSASNHAQHHEAGSSEEVPLTLRQAWRKLHA